MRQDIKRGLYRYWIFQLATLMLLSVIFAFGFGLKALLSVVVSGMVFMVPNIFFAWRVFKDKGARQANKIIGGFYQAEGIKLVLTVFLFMLVFVTMRVHELAFFITYLVLLVTQWLAPMFLVKDGR